MILLLKPIARLATFLLLVLLAVAGLVVAIFSIGAPDAPLGFGGLARFLGLSELSDTVGSWLQGIDGPSAFPERTVLFALAAILLGLLLLAGALGRPPDRLVVLEERDGSRLAARPRALAQVADAMIGRPRGVTDRRVRVKPKRGGGVLEVRATYARSAEPREIESQVTRAVAPLTDAFGLRTRVDARSGEPGSRVE
jgi:hypothetical protein